MSARHWLPTPALGAVLLAGCSLNPIGEDPGYGSDDRETSDAFDPDPFDNDGVSGDMGAPASPTAAPGPAASGGVTSSPVTPAAPATPGAGSVPEPEGSVPPPAVPQPPSASGGASSVDPGPVVIDPEPVSEPLPPEPAPVPTVDGGPSFDGDAGAPDAGAFPDSAR